MIEPIHVMRARYECQCCGRNLTVTESYRGTDKNDDPDGYYYVFDEAPDIKRWITSSAAAVRFKKIEISDVERVINLIRKAERSLGYQCSDGNRKDLIADNFNEWPLDYIKHVYEDAKPFLDR